MNGHLDMGSRNDHRSQSDKFEETARELGVDLDEDKLKEALRRMSGPRAINERPGEDGLEPPVVNGRVQGDP